MNIKVNKNEHHKDLYLDWIQFFYSEYEEKITLRDISSVKSNLYHYTSPRGLKGIIENKELWFSNIIFLNDKNEMRYTYELVCNVIDSLLQINKSTYLLRILDMCKKCLINEKLSDISDCFYVASFSEQQDNLSLWNYYTKNKNKTGYNIEFKKNIILAFKKASKARLRFSEVFYDVEKQKSMLTEAFKNFELFYIKANEELQEQIIKDTFRLIDLYSQLFKHPAFSAEQEFRLIFPMLISENNTLFREYNGFFIPYIPCEFNKNFIKSITISPTANEDLTANSLKLLLKANKLDRVKINTSNIPLRY